MEAQKLTSPLRVPSFLPCTPRQKKYPRATTTRDELTSRIPVTSGALPSRHSPRRCRSRASQDRQMDPSSTLRKNRDRSAVLICSHNAVFCIKSPPPTILSAEGGLCAGHQANYARALWVISPMASARNTSNTLRTCTGTLLRKKDRTSLRLFLLFKYYIKLPDAVKAWGPSKSCRWAQHSTPSRRITDTSKAVRWRLSPFSSLV